MAEHGAFRYDLFIVHADADRAWVDGYLKHAVGVEPASLMTRRDFVPGAATPAEFDRAVASSRYTVLVLSPAFLADRWAEFGEQLVTFTRVEEGRGRVLTITLHPCQPPLHLRFLVGLDCTGWEQWDDEVAKLRDLLGRPMPEPEVIPCPFPGMAAFRPEEQRFFHGRDQEIDDLLRSIRAHSFLLVVGPSGSGKSSLVWAGLMPRLDDLSLFPAGFWRVRALRPGATPLARLTEQLGGSPLQSAETVTAVLEADPPAHRLLVFVDQFEELFTQVAEREAQQAFIEALKMLRGDPRCVMIVAMRADFFSDLMNCPLWPVDRNQLIEVSPLRGEALRPAIVRPAEKVGVYLEEGLVERLIADAANEPGSLPMLQEALVLLWAKRQHRLLTRAAYSALGRDGRSGLAVAMATKADATLSAMPPDEQRLARRIFLRLIQFGEGRPDTRRQVAQDDLRSVQEPPEIFDHVLSQLIANRLLTPSSEDQGPRRIDIAHEMLIVGWPASQEWVRRRRESELTRRRLETKASEWVRLGRGPGGRLDEAELPEAARWLSSPDASELGYDATLPALVEASTTQLERAEHAARLRARNTIAALAGGLVIVAALAVWAGLSAANARLAAIKANRAAVSEKAAKQEAMAETIQVAMARGDWRAALKTIDQALSEGFDDPVGLRLERVRALCGAQDVAAANAEIQALTEMPNLGKYEGAVLLWRGDVERSRSSSPQDPLALVRAALRKGIRGADDRRERADREYAEGLLAVTVADSKAHFRNAIDAMPSHQRANGMLALLLIFTGDVSGARQQVAVAEILFPDDPTFVILDAWTAALDNQLGAANKILDKLAGEQADNSRLRINEHQVRRRRRRIASLLNQCRSLDAAGDDYTAYISWLREVLATLAQEGGLFDPVVRPETSLFFPAPPVLFSYIPHVTGLMLFLPVSRFTGNYARVNQLLSNMIRINPDGFLHYFHGVTSFMDQSQPEPERYRRAEAAFQKAAEAESLLPVRHVAKYQAMNMAFLIATAPPYDREMRNKAAAIMREIVDAGKFQPDMVSSLATIACSVEDWDRARWLLARGRENVPEHRRPQIEFANHAYDRAIDEADKLLRSNPKHRDALFIKAEAMKALNRLQDRFKLDSPPAVRPP